MARKLNQTASRDADPSLTGAQKFELGRHPTDSQVSPNDEGSWAERNANALEALGKCIAKTGLAGVEFDQI